MRKWLLLLAINVCFSTVNAQNWDNWRGPFSNGTTDETGLVDQLDTDENLLWSVDIEGSSSSTPVIYGKKVFLTTSIKDSKKLTALCLNTETGRVEWSQTVGDANQTIPRNTMAASSPVVDATGAYFTFADGTIAKLSPDGKDIWKRNIVDEYGPLSIKFGFSSSPLLHKGTLYLAVMRRQETYRKSDWTGTMDSYLLAIDAGTGKNKFKVSRDTDAVDESTNSYTSCIPVKVNGQTQIVVHGGDYVTGHDPADGKELWRYHYGNTDDRIGRLVPTPVADDGRLYFLHPRGVKMIALNLKKFTDGKPSVIWTYDRQGPDASSPPLYKGYLYLVDDIKQKTLTCLEAATGKACWVGQLDKKGTYYGSVSCADDKLYLMSEKGLAYVIAADPKEFKILSSARFEEGGVNATPGIADGKVFIRTKTTLYCFGQ
ncbi:MAG: outer membrane protein assembly factor BamB family protein [Planctomycetota bacterium]|jgi:outer membrane protein assembly factor BamB